MSYKDPEWHPIAWYYRNRPEDVKELKANMNAWRRLVRMSREPSPYQTTTENR